MKRLRVAYRREAIADLDDILRIILQISRSPVTAERFLERIRARCRRIGKVPYGGRPRGDLRPGLRTVPFEKTAVIVYSVSDRVEIIDIFYGGRDYEALYRRAGPEAEEPE